MYRKFDKKIWLDNTKKDSYILWSQKLIFFDAPRGHPLKLTKIILAGHLLNRNNFGTRANFFTALVFRGVDPNYWPTQPIFHDFDTITLICKHTGVIAVISKFFFLCFSKH
jgi:hypothetical protein